MFLLDNTVIWSASDLTMAAECEYALLRQLDARSGLGPASDAKADPFLEHLSALGDQHELRLLEEYRVAKDVVSLERAKWPYSHEVLEAARDTTRQTFTEGPDVVHGAAFFEGEFFGYADFIERGPDGWVVCDAKLARSAKPRALLQLGAYAEQLVLLELDVAPRVSLLLGNGRRADFNTSDVLPVYHERRDRLRELIADHLRDGSAAAWGDDRYTACGACPECRDAAAASNDVVGVAGLRMEQRRKLREAGIETIEKLVHAEIKPPTMTAATFEKLRAQARLQWSQSQSDDQSVVVHELLESAPDVLAALPAPSDGDLFFDFEGDPLYDEGDFERTGLEYLWGVLDTEGIYVPLWAHTHVEEKQAFLKFMELVAAKRAKFPDMHIYHYAPYETTALKRLAMRYQVQEDELDDLLRSAAFVDLYATVRGSVRVGQPSYSIKKLEPLYMGDHLRSEGDDAVVGGDASVVAYHEYRAWTASDPAAAAQRLVALADYNEYDCLSTLKLRDWLLERAVEAGVRDRIVPRLGLPQPEEPTGVDPLFDALIARSGPELRIQRTSDEQAYAMLAGSLDFHRREHKQFWWEHYERLSSQVDDWNDARNVFIVETAEVVTDWAPPTGKQRNHRRTVRLVGDWTPGSKVEGTFRPVYKTPGPPGLDAPEGAPFGCTKSISVSWSSDEPRVVLIVDDQKAEAMSDDLPVALVPGPPPDTRSIAAAIEELARDTVACDDLPTTAGLDVLARRPPRLRNKSALPTEGSLIENAVAALTGMDDSYVAIQGPPGSGKTYSGSRVIRQLVEQHGWRVGVVAQSHAVVENMLDAVIKAGLAPDRIGKTKPKADSPAWKKLEDVGQFLDDNAATGCVVGGTAWDFVNANRVEREQLDLLVIDEAGQFSLAPTLAVSVSAKRLLLLGDPQQLPQVSQGTHAEPVAESALAWVMAGHDTIPPELGYFLDRSYRMHTRVCEKVSTLSYDEKLFAAPQASLRGLEGVEPGVTVVDVEHRGNRVESPEEADEVVRQIQNCIGRQWTDPDDSAAPRPLGESDFLVVAPYNAQAAAIRAALASAGLACVRVGTVDKFQGQEAPIAIVSMTASSHGDVPRGMAFLLNRNRVNVAISRAQWRAIIVRSSALTDFLPASVPEFLELGAFIGLCRSAQHSVPNARESANGGNAPPSRGTRFASRSRGISQRQPNGRPTVD